MDIYIYIYRERERERERLKNSKAKISHKISAYWFNKNNRFDYIFTFTTKKGSVYSGGSTGVGKGGFGFLGAWPSPFDSKKFQYL